MVFFVTFTLQIPPNCIKVFVSFKYKVKVNLKQITNEQDISAGTLT